MWATQNGHLKIVRTLLEYGVDVNAQSDVRNQVMMISLIVMLMMIVFNDEDRDYTIVDNDDRRSMYLC